MSGTRLLPEMSLPLLRLLRPADWVKNVLVFPAFVFGLPGLLERGESVLPLAGRSLVAFAAFCCISSGFYAINDVIDAPRDRLHPVKRLRPVASGAVSARVALLLGGALIAAALLLAAVIGWMLVVVLVAYAVMQIAYNVGIKRVMFVDAVILAAGFGMRATAGAVAIAVPISAWLLLCVFFLCLFLAFIKRLCDLTSAREAGSTWRSPAGYDDPGELDWLLGVSAVLSIVTYLMYALSDHAWALFQSRTIGFAMLVPLPMICMHRFYRLARHGHADSPLEAIRTDRIMAAAAGLFSLGVLAAIYVPPVQAVLDHIFLARPGGGALHPAWHPAPAVP